MLTEALRRMRDSLQRHIELRAESLAAQTRLEHELQIAASIQQSMLPRPDSVTHADSGAKSAQRCCRRNTSAAISTTISPSATARCCSWSATCPTRAFRPRSSWRGCRRLIRVLGTKGELPDSCSGATQRAPPRRQRCVHVRRPWAAECSTSDGAHPLRERGPRCRRCCARSDGNVRPLLAENGPAHRHRRRASTTSLLEAFIAPGDTLVLFTDGVTEAAAEDGSLFGHRATRRAAARQAPDGDPDVIVRRIVDAVATHASGFHATDDLTVLAIGIAAAGRHGVRSEGESHALAHRAGRSRPPACNRRSDGCTPSSLPAASSPRAASATPS